MEKRLLSTKRWWTLGLGTLVFYLLYWWHESLFNLIAPTASEREREPIILLIGTLFPIVCYLHQLWRVRPYIWPEVVDEGEYWVLRRKEKTLRIDPAKIKQIYPFSFGWLALSFYPQANLPSIVIFRPARRHKGQLSLYEEISLRISKNRERYWAALAPSPPERLIKAVPISSPRTFWIKRIIPNLAFGALFLWAAWRWSVMAASGEWSGVEVSLTLIAGIFFFVLHHEYLSNLQDRVEDEGDALLLTHGKEQTRIPLEEIAQLHYRPMEGFHWITVELNAPRKIGQQTGRKFAFIPQGKSSLHGWNAQIDALEGRWMTLKAGPQRVNAAI